jgi:hypothetical protein
MEARIQLVAVIASTALLFFVLELVRRKRFLERYALVWLLSAVVMLALAIWRGALETLGSAIGVAYPPNALFLVAFGFVLALLLHFSLAVSRLSDQTKVLAQRLALLEERVRRAGPHTETTDDHERQLAYAAERHGDGESGDGRD